MKQKTNNTRVSEASRGGCVYIFSVALLVNIRVTEKLDRHPGRRLLRPWTWDLRYNITLYNNMCVGGTTWSDGPCVRSTVNHHGAAAHAGYGDAPNGADAVPMALPSSSGAMPEMPNTFFCVCRSIVHGRRGGGRGGAHIFSERERESASRSAVGGGGGGGGGDTGALRAHTHDDKHTTTAHTQTTQRTASAVLAASSVRKWPGVLKSSSKKRTACGLNTA